MVKVISNLFEFVKDVSMGTAKALPLGRVVSMEFSNHSQMLWAARDDDVEGLACLLVAKFLSEFLMFLRRMSNVNLPAIGMDKVV
jgi:hypothetical protein